MAVLKTVKQTGNSGSRDDRPWQWKKGKSGNPRGRPPKGHAIADILNKLGLEEVAVEGGSKRTRREQMLRRVYEEAIKGEPWAVHFIADRTEGKVTQVYREEGGLAAYRNLTDDELRREIEKLDARVGELTGGAGTPVV